MTTTQKLALGVVATTLVATLASWQSGPREPEWAGRPFSAWWADLYSLSEPAHSAAAVARRAPAQEAIRGMGLASVPLILERMHAPDTVTRLQADEWLARAGWRQHPLVPGAAEQGRAMFAFQALGSAGVDAIPHLRLMLDDPRLTHSAAVSLGWIGAASLSTLTEAARHRDAWVRYWATIGLGWLNEDARAAVPELRRAFASEPDAQVRCAIAWTLLRVRCEWRGTLPVLATALQDPTDPSAATIAGWLGALGGEATAALPELRAASQRTPLAQHEALLAAIRRIESGAR